MGCGSSRDLPLSIDDETEEKLDVNEEEIENEALDIPEKVNPESSPEESAKTDIPLTPVKENGTANLEPILPKPEEEIIPRPKSDSSSKRGESSVSFEVVDDSLIRKHPPKKFQRLEDMQTGGAVTLTPEELEMKQEIARKRRQNLLNKRVQSAKERSAKSAHIRSNTDENHEDDESVIESPDDM